MAYQRVMPPHLIAIALLVTALTVLIAWLIVRADMAAGGVDGVAPEDEAEPTGRDRAG